MHHEYERHLRAWLLRRKRLRRLLRPLPRRANVARYPIIKWFADHARQAPYLWSFKRGPVMKALYLGSVLALLPTLGFQVLIAFGASLLLRANLTLTVALQFITNPFTAVPIYGFTAWVGAGALRLFGHDTDLSALGEIFGGDSSKLLQASGELISSLFIGGLLVGLGVALLADLGWRIAAWEARIFRERLRHLHWHVHGPGKAAAEAKPPARKDG